MDEMTLDPTVEKDHFKMANPVEKIPSLCRRRIVQLAVAAFAFFGVKCRWDCIQLGDE